MKQCLAIWHYPHRTLLENVAFFADNGFDAVSVGGAHMYQACCDEQVADALAELLKNKGTPMTVHYKLPSSHTAEDVADFEKFVRAVGAWQKKHGLIHILSFDVYDAIRDNIRPYVDFVLKEVPDSMIAVEDFGLTARERTQVAHLLGNPRFGYLVDIGHLYIRIKGLNQENKALFTNSPDECPACDHPGLAEVRRAFASKEFPIVEIHLHGNNGVDDQHLFLEDGELDISKMIARYVVDASGKVKETQLVFSMAMDSDVSDEETDEVTTLGLIYDYDMTVKVKATGNKVKISYPSFSGFAAVDPDELG